MRYLVQAINQDNQLLTLEIDAPDQESLRLHPELSGYSVLQVKNKNWQVAQLFHTKTKLHFPILLFSRELLALLTAGLSLIEAIDTLVEKEQHTGNRRLLEALRVSLYQGKSLSDGLAAFPEVFSDFYVANIRASERTGSMCETLQRYIRYEEQADVIRKRIVSASIYPVVLLVVGFLVSLFLMFYVVPRFGSVYEEMRGEIPFFSKVLLNWGKLFSAHMTEILGAILLVVTAAGYALTRKTIRVWLTRHIVRLPAIGERVRLYQLSRLYRTLGMLLRGGIPVVVAIDMAKGMLGAELQARLSNAVRDIREGLSLSNSMEKYQLHTAVSARLMRVGERTGEMGEMLERTAEFMDEEMARWIEWFTKLFEPLLMAVIGIVIGLIVVLMYMPIFELASNVQ